MTTKNYVTERTARHDRQRSDSIGRIVLQTVAQKVKLKPDPQKSGFNPFWD